MRAVTTTGEVDGRPARGPAAETKSAAPQQPADRVLAGATVLITGGTGSFGRTMTRYLLERGCAEIRIFSRDEAKQDAMRGEFNSPLLRFYLGDVRHRPSLSAALEGADFVFHAAALKQVPSCEFFPMQAVLTNVVGSENVIEEGVARGVRSIVCLSTDKAVYPINAMGMSKALMEKVAQARARGSRSTDVTVSCVRYGNVMFSRGSVIPLFVDKIRRRQPIPVTEPTMTRFMLPLIQAVELVEFAFLNARPGDIFVRKAPAATLYDLATAMKRIFRADNPIEVIGFRHGEKLYETLATKEELRRSDDLGDFLRVRMDDRDLNYDKYFEEGDPLEITTDDYHSHNTRRLGVHEVEQLLLTLPEIRAALEEMFGPQSAQPLIESLPAP